MGFDIVAHQRISNGSASALRLSLDQLSSTQPLSNLVLRVASRVPSSQRSYACFIIRRYILKARFLQLGTDSEPEVAL